MITRCPHCHMDITQGNVSRRICSKCERQIGSHHKWFFGADGRPQHRNCQHPYDYVESLPDADEMPQSLQDSWKEES